MAREMSEEGKAFIKRRESCRLSPHWDAIAGVWDIGWGHRLADGEPRVAITQEEADALFDVDVHMRTDQLNEMLTVDLPQPIYDAVASLLYNAGSAAIAASSVIAFLNAGQFADACVSLLQWRKSKGVDVDGLLLRRAKESVMFSEGIYLP